MYSLKKPTFIAAATTSSTGMVTVFLITGEWLSVFLCSHILMLRNDSSHALFLFHFAKTIFFFQEISYLCIVVPYMLKITPWHLFPSVTSGLGVYLSQGINLRRAFTSLTQSVFLLKHTYF